MSTHGDYVQMKPIYKSVVVAVITTASLCISADALARDIYVNNQIGSDFLDGFSEDRGQGKIGPVKTITRALALARRGDNIVLANTGQSYHESISIQGARHSGLKKKPFLIVGNGATLDGTRTIKPEEWDIVDNAVFEMTPRETTRTLLYLDGKPATSVAVNRDATKVPELAPNQWCIYRGRIYFKCEEGKIPLDYELSLTDLQVGISIYNVRGLIISDLTIQGFRQDGINAHDNVFECELAELRVRGNGRSGISVGGSSRVLIEACLIGSNGKTQVRTEARSIVKLRSNDIISADDGTGVDDGGAQVIQED